MLRESLTFLDLLVNPDESQNLRIEDETGRGSAPFQLPCASSSSALQQMAVQPNEVIYEDYRFA